MGRLTPKQAKFVDEYLIDLNATQAAVRAGYKNSNIGRRLVTKSNVSEHIQKRLADRERRTEITQDMVIKEIAEVGFAEAADYTDSKLKYSNKLRALELLGKHMGMFSERAADNGGELMKLIEGLKDE